MPSLFYRAGNFYWFCGGKCKSHYDATLFCLPRVHLIGMPFQNWINTRRMKLILSGRKILVLLSPAFVPSRCWFLIDLTIKLMMIIKLLLDVSTLSSVILKSFKVTVTWEFE